MSGEARRAAVAALVELATEADYRDRAAAGRALASFAEEPAAREALAGLVLDAGDTFVTFATAEALLRRQDAIGYATVASTLTVAGPSHVDWIGDAVVAVFQVFSRDRDAALRWCQEAADDPDERVRRGAHELDDMLAEIEPILQADDA